MFILCTRIYRVEGIQFSFFPFGLRVCTGCVESWLQVVNDECAVQPPPGGSEAAESSVNGQAHVASFSAFTLFAWMSTEAECLSDAVCRVGVSGMESLEGP